MNLNGLQRGGGSDAEPGTSLARGCWLRPCTCVSLAGTKTRWVHRVGEGMRDEPRDSNGEKQQPLSPSVCTCGAQTGCRAGLELSRGSCCGSSGTSPDLLLQCWLRCDIGGS